MLVGGVASLYEGIFPMTAEAIVKVGIRYFAFQFFTEQYNIRVHGDKNKPSRFFSFSSFFSNCGIALV